MTVLHLTCSFSSEVKPQQFVKEQIKALTKYSSDRHVLAAVLITKSTESLQTKLRILNKAEDGIEGAIYELQSRFWKSLLHHPPFLLKQFRHIYRHIGDGLNPDLLHAHLAFPTGIVTRQFAKQLGLPYLISDHSNVLFKILEKHPLRQMANKALGDAKALIVPNRDKFNLLTPFVNTLTKLEIVPNAVDKSIFHYKPKLIRSELHLVTVSPLTISRRLDLLIDAVAKLEQLGHFCRLTIIGRGPLSSALQARTSDHHASVRFVGQQTPKQIAVHFNDSDAVLFSGLNHSYGPYFAEAIATGTPIIVSTMVSWKDAVSPELGLVILPDVLAWVNGILALKQQQYDHEAIAEYADLTFKSDVIASQLGKVYQNILG